MLDAFRFSTSEHPDGITISGEEMRFFAMQMLNLADSQNQAYTLATNFHEAHQKCEDFSCFFHIAIYAAIQLGKLTLDNGHLPEIEIESQRIAQHQKHFTLSTQPTS